MSSKNFDNLTVNEVDELIKKEILNGKRFKDVKEVYNIGKSRFSRLLKELEKENEDFHNSRERRSLRANKLAYINVCKTGYRVNKCFNRSVVNYGTFPKKNQALYIRDKLLNVDWNQKLLSKEDQQLIEKHITKNTNRTSLKYIKQTPSGVKIIYKNTNYGDFNTLGEAIKERNKLIKEKKIR